MKIEKDLLENLLAEIGRRLSSPATLCIVGSAAAILSGQPERQTPDIDIWGPESDFDAGDLKQAVETTGLLFDPKGEVGPDDAYLQVLRPGITLFPAKFPTSISVEKLGRYGQLTLVMPPPAMIVATKLARGYDSDLEDAVWW